LKEISGIEPFSSRALGKPFETLRLRDDMMATETPHPSVESTPSPEKPKKSPKKKSKNFNQIHRNPLPLQTHPLPAFHPSNPISLLRLAYTWISHIIFPLTSHPLEPYIGYFSPETRSVHITNPDHVKALWEMGFFGKGSLSRSEPSWLDRVRDGGGAELATNVRREERRLFKLERARLEREGIERQRRIEEGREDEALDVASALDGDLGAGNLEKGAKNVTDAPPNGVETFPPETTHMNGHIQHSNSSEDEAATAVPPESKDELGASMSPDTPSSDPVTQDSDLIQNEEHLQLTFEEAFFISYGLGALTILPPPLPDSPPLSPKFGPQTYSYVDLLHIFSAHSHITPTPDISPDDPFLLSYTTYHHYRSLGWVVRPGTKFGVDFLLYNRGPVFSHAEFAVIIMPSYTHRYWNSPGGRGQRRVQEDQGWWWLHAVNRVQSQVKKTLVLSYVEVPSPFEIDFEGGIGSVLGCYRVRDFVVRRWLANRSRD
jgi:tRNA-splicing endonuclease subunit Sen2